MIIQVIIIIVIYSLKEVLNYKLTRLVRDKQVILIQHFKTKTMKNIFYILILLLFITACGKENNNVDPTKTKTEFSGVLVGSTGYYSLILESGNSSATIYFDSVLYTLTNTEVLDFNAGIYDLVLSDSNNVTLTVTLPPNSSQPSFYFNIPNHTVEYTVFQVEINLPVNNYLGTSSSSYTVSDSSGNILSNSNYNATYNLSIQGDNNFQIIEKNGGNTYYYRGGVQFIGTNIVKFTFIDNGQENEITAQRNGNNIFNAQTETFYNNLGQLETSTFSFNFVLQ